MRKNFGLSDLDKSGQVAWNNLMGPNALTSKSLRRDSKEVESIEAKDMAFPAFAMMMSIKVIPNVCMVFIAAEKSVSEVLSR